MDRDGGAREGIASTRPRLICIPSSDTGFGALAHLRLAEVDDPPALEDLLRLVYPKARVHRRELAAEPDDTWYVYRDGTFHRPRETD